ncbi:MAG: PadR family transcriptional regulator [Clostridiales bacterium]|nr:PadR family transcriptional regulator [Clostridiales bacterium]
MNRDQELFCPGKPHMMKHFMEVCLLLLLFDQPGYGYGLAEALLSCGFDETHINISTLYRTLRNMEKENRVTSFWKEGGPGPKRRMYKITEKGKKELEDWVKVLQKRKERIEFILDRYTKVSGHDNNDRHL